MIEWTNVHTNDVEAKDWLARAKKSNEGKNLGTCLVLGNIQCFVFVWIEKF